MDLMNRPAEKVGRFLYDKRRFLQRHIYSYLPFFRQTCQKD